MEITDRQALGVQDREILDAWEGLFNSFAWDLIQRRFRPHFEAIIGEMETCEDQRTLGYAQGKRQILRELLELEYVLESEFNSMLAYQAEPGEV